MQDHTNSPTNGLAENIDREIQVREREGMEGLQCHRLRRRR